MCKRLKDCKKILIINHFGIGDVLFSMPLVDNIKLNFPDASISYVCNGRVAPLLQNNGAINQVFVYDRDEYAKTYKNSKIYFWKKIFTFVAQIRHEDFDIVFDCSLNTTINFMTYLAGIKERVGFNYKGRSPLLTRKFHLDSFEGKHVVEFYLDIIKNIGLDVRSREMYINISKEDNYFAEELFKSHNISSEKPIIGVLPGAGASWGADAKYRRWPKENYVKLVDKMIENLSAQIILMGDAKEAELCSEIEKKWGSKILPTCGKTTVSQLAAMLSKCDIVVLNDGGPLHLAVSVGTKTVSIFGPVDDKVYGPFGNKDDHIVVKSNIACSPCYKRFRMSPCSHVSCLQRISVDDVFDKVKELGGF